MIDAIKRFFNEHIQAGDSTDQSSEHALQVASTAILLEMARADFDVKDDELAKVASSIRKIFDLSADDTDQLVKLAEQQAQQATCYYEFTTLINNEFSVEQKIHLVELMWEVAYADAHLEKYEEALVRKISDLLYIKHADFIAAKHRVLERRSN